MTGDLSEGTKQTLRRVVEQAAPENVLRALIEIYSDRTGRFDAVVAGYMTAALDVIDQMLPGSSTPYDFEKEGLTLGQMAASRAAMNPSTPLEIVVDSVIADRVIAMKIKEMGQKIEYFPFVVTGINELGEEAERVVMEKGTMKEMVRTIMEMKNDGKVVRIVADAAV